MRVAVPSEDQTTIAMHTGRARGFLIIDISGEKSEIVEYRLNGFTHHRQSQADHHHGQNCGHHGESHGGHGSHHSHIGLLLALDDCQAMLAGGMGPRLVQDLVTAGKKVYLSSERTIERAAADLMQGKLVPVTEIDSCRHKAQA